tara:strand:+ start:302 stop:490 length:189 start_codon:yes stop_codon:yes gene_type:complete
MTVLEQYQEAFKNLKTQIVEGDDKIKLHVWSESLLSNTMVKDVLEFNLDGSEIQKEPIVNFY